MLLSPRKNGLDSSPYFKEVRGFQGSSDLSRVDAHMPMPSVCIRFPSLWVWRKRPNFGPVGLLRMVCYV